MTKPLILIVDDVLENVQLLGEALSSSYRIQFAASGEEGLQLIEQHRPDLILLDVMMPGMSGYEVFSRLKTDSALENIPVIFVTAKNDAKSESEAILAGAADFIHKPINLDVVRARVRMQLQLARNRKQLEQLVVARTAELATARFEAESANAVKTRFMANVSHEMRTPLQGILGFAEIGQRRASDAGDDKIRDYFEKILQSGHRMHSLVESLLTLTEDAWRNQAGENNGHFEQIDLHGFATEITTLMNLQAEQRQQRVNLEINTSATSFTGDPVRLRQVLDHLLANALEYSGAAATVTFRIDDAQLKSGRATTWTPALSLQIIDQGCGIPESEINAIFEPFYQSSRTANGAGGTGLGLPLSRNIIQRHRGTLRLSNRPEGGVIAEILLPLS